MLDDRNIVFIPGSEYSKLERSHIFRNDVLLTIVGANTGQTALVFEHHEKLTANCKLGIIRPILGSNAAPAFLHAFLASKYGQQQIQLAKRGGGQTGLILPDLKGLRIPRFSDTLEKAISNCSLNAHRIRSESKTILQTAEKVLLRSLNLENWQPPNPLSYTRSSADAFAAGRFDAEYFYPAKAAAQAYLNALPGKTIGSMFDSVRELWQPENAPANQLVRNYDLNDALSPFLDDAKEPSYPAEIASTKKRIQKGDIVVSRLRSYLKEIAVVQDDSKEPLVGSTEFIVLRPKTEAIPVEALLVFLRSTLPQLIFQWSQDGSNHPRFDEKELLNLHVPDVVSAISKELTDSVNVATNARQRAKELLEAAKRAVEIAIEESETAALAYLADFS